MSELQTAAIIMFMVTLASYINHRWLKMSPTIGVMTVSLLISLVLVLLNAVGINLEQFADKVMENVAFSEVFIHGILGFLLFTAALQVDLRELLKVKGPVFSIALLGTTVVAGLVSVLAYYTFMLLGISIPFIYCLLFGALISPTDTVAVIAMLKNANAPKSLEMKIAGESLFNDGIGMVLFTVVSAMITSPESVTVSSALLLLIKLTLGGTIFGTIIGWCVRKLNNTVLGNPTMQVLLSLSLVMSAYALANEIGISGPITVIIAGLIVGMPDEKHGVQSLHKHYPSSQFHTYWEIMDEILNSVLFVLIGLEFVQIPFSKWGILMGTLITPVVLFSRWVSVWSPLLLVSGKINWREVNLLTWGGLRGALVIAMALLIPEGEYRDIIVVMAYLAAIFSILIQGLSFSKMKYPEYQQP